MPSERKKKGLQIVLENGTPSAVILDIEDYRQGLEALGADAGKTTTVPSSG